MKPLPSSTRTRVRLGYNIRLLSVCLLAASSTPDLSAQAAITNNLQVVEIMSGQSTNVSVFADFSCSMFLSSDPYPTNGTLMGILHGMTYQPNPGYAGDDYFVLRLEPNCPGQVNQYWPVLVHVLAPPPPPPPVTNALQVVELESGQSTNITVFANFSCSMSLSSDPYPTNGTLMGIFHGVNYQSNPGYVGDDYFVVRLEPNCPELVNQYWPVLVHVLAPPPPPPPVTNTLQVVEVESGQSTNITVFANFSCSMSLSSDPYPTNGTLMGIFHGMTYLPNPGYVGDDYFVLRLEPNCPELVNQYWPVLVHVLAPPPPPPPPPPVTNALQVVELESGQRTNITVFANFSCSMSLSSDPYPTNGTLMGIFHGMTYQPNPGYVGDDYFVVRLEPNCPEFVNQYWPVLVHVLAPPPPPPPVTNALQVVVLESGQSTNVTVFANFSCSMSLSSDPYPTNGTLMGIFHGMTYQPNPGYVGDDYFVVRLEPNCPELVNQYWPVLVHVLEPPPTEPPITNALQVIEVVSGHDTNLFFAAPGFSVSCSVDSTLDRSPTNGTISALHFDVPANATTATYWPNSVYVGNDYFVVRAKTSMCSQNPGARYLEYWPVLVHVLGAHSLEQHVLADITTLRMTVTKRTDSDRLDAAIGYLTDSLDLALWVDETHLVPRQGDKAFQKQKDAVRKLLDLVDDTRSSVPASTLQSLIAQLLAVDRMLAVTSVQEAAASMANARKIAEDQNEIVPGDADAAADRPLEAIEHYRNAWIHAIHLQQQSGILATGHGVRVHFLAFPGDRWVIQASTNLTDWVALGVFTADADGVIVYDDPDSAFLPTRFYRAAMP